MRALFVLLIFANYANAQSISIVDKYIEYNGQVPGIRVDGTMTLPQPMGDGVNTFAVQVTYSCQIDPNTTITFTKTLGPYFWIFSGTFNWSCWDSQYNLPEGLYTIEAVLILNNVPASVTSTTLLVFYG